MSNYECPNCRGGFEEPTNNECPWCGQALDGSFEREPPEVISKVVDGDGQQGSPLEKMLGFGGGR